MVVGELSGWALCVREVPQRLRSSGSGGIGRIAKEDRKFREISIKQSTSVVTTASMML